MIKTTLEETNAELQKELTAENEKYYGNLLIYVRAKSIIRDNQQSETLLLEILQDLLDAQNQGISAEEYFGKNPKQIADEIIKQLPIKLIDLEKVMLTGLVTYLLIMFIPTLIDPTKGIDLGRYLIVGLLTVIFAIFILKLLGHSVYCYQSKVSSLLFYTFILVGLVCGLLLMIFISTPLVITLNRTTGILFILLTGFILAALFIREKDKAPWIPFIPLLSVYLFGGILLRINDFSSFLNSKTGQLVIAASLIGALFIQALLMFLLNRKKRV